MKKSYLYLGAVAIIIVAMETGIYAYANVPKAKGFTGIGGKKITVYSDNYSTTDTTGNNTENESIRAGDIINGDVGEEIIIGVSDTPSYF